MSFSIQVIVLVFTQPLVSLSHQECTGISFLVVSLVLGSAAAWCWRVKGQRTGFGTACALMVRGVGVELCGAGTKASLTSLSAMLILSCDAG